MKKRFYSLYILICAWALTTNAAQAQCSVFAEEVLDKTCTGIHLIHQELDNQHDHTIRLLLNGGNRYVVYLLNASQAIKNYKLTCTNADLDMISILNKQKEARKYHINITKSQEYDFSVDFSTNKDACVLLAVYLQNEPDKFHAVYESLAALNQNRGQTQNIQLFEKLRRNKQEKVFQFEHKKRPTLCFGFTDGQEKYYKTSNNAFVRLEDLIDFYYFTESEEDWVVIQQASGATNRYPIPKQVAYVLHKRTGAVMELNKNTVRQLIRTDQELLEAFDAEKQKSKKLKEYLRKYSQRN